MCSSCKHLEVPRFENADGKYPIIQDCLHMNKLSFKHFPCIIAAPIKLASPQGTAVHDCDLS